MIFIKIDKNKFLEINTDKPLDVHVSQKDIAQVFETKVIDWEQITREYAFSVDELEKLACGQTGFKFHF